MPCSRFLMYTSVWWRGRRPDCSWLPVWSQCRRGGACPEVSCARTGWPRFPGTSYGRLKNTAKQRNKETQQTNMRIQVQAHILYTMAVLNTCAIQYIKVKQHETDLWTKPLHDYKDVTNKRFMLVSPLNQCCRMIPEQRFGSQCDQISLYQNCKREWLPPHTPLHETLPGCHTRDTWMALSASSVCVFEPPWTSGCFWKGPESWRFRLPSHLNLRWQRQRRNKGLQLSEDQNLKKYSGKSTKWTENVN